MKRIAIIMALIFCCTLALASCDAIDGILDLFNPEEEEPELPQETAEEALARLLNSKSFGELSDELEDKATPDVAQALAGKKMQFDLIGEAGGEAVGLRTVVADGLVYSVLGDGSIWELQSVSWFTEDMMYTLPAAYQNAPAEGYIEIRGKGLDELLENGSESGESIDYSELLGQYYAIFKDVKLDKITPDKISKDGKWYVIDGDFVNETLQKTIIFALGEASGAEVDEEVKKKISDTVAAADIELKLNFDGKEICGIGLDVCLGEGFFEAISDEADTGIDFNEIAFSLTLSNDASKRESSCEYTLSIDTNEASDLTADFNMQVTYDGEEKITKLDSSASFGATDVTVNGGEELMDLEMSYSMSADLGKAYIKSADVMSLDFDAVATDNDGAETCLMKLLFSVSNDADGNGHASLTVSGNTFTEVSLDGVAYYDRIMNPPTITGHVAEITPIASALQKAVDETAAAIIEEAKKEHMQYGDAYLYLSEFDKTVHVYASLEDNLYTPDRTFIYYYIFDGKAARADDILYGYTEYSYKGGSLVKNQIKGTATAAAERAIAALDNADIQFILDSGCPTLYLPLNVKDAFGNDRYATFKVEIYGGGAVLDGGVAVSDVDPEDREHKMYLIEFSDGAETEVTVSFRDDYYGRIGDEILALLDFEHIPAGQNFLNLYFVLDETTDIGDPIYLELTYGVRDGEIFRFDSYNLRQLRFVSDDTITLVAFSDSEHTDVDIETVETPAHVGEKLAAEILALIGEEDEAYIGEFGSDWWYGTGIINGSGEQLYVCLRLTVSEGAVKCTYSSERYFEGMMDGWIYVDFDDESHSGITVVRHAED